MTQPDTVQKNLIPIQVKRNQRKKKPTSNNIKIERVKNYKNLI